MSSRLIASLLSLFLAALTLSGCKQGEGDVCQVTEDCEAGLICNAVTGRCQTETTDTDPPDAAPAIDAAPTVDAPADAQIDAGNSVW
ncbi:MAG: hypothetical protein MJE77_32520 [Proteobacteria bacterium]|nr:hypothetical protein [Pseudomonadota bacterium]